MSAAAAIDGAGGPSGRIGPNAIIRVIEALEQVEGPPTVRRILQASRLEAYLCAPPTEMVDEQEVLRLHQGLHEDLGVHRARAVGRLAGRLTAEYLLGFRIPQPAQIALRCCPDRLSSRMLAKAISKNAWTFAGTGAFSACHGPPTIYTIQNCPICRGQRSAEPYCDFYTATFERLYSRLINKGALVTETACEAMGAPACMFQITW